jgi:hypothetical protein
MRTVVLLKADCVARLLSLLLLLALPVVGQAQDAYSTNADGSVYTYSTNTDGSVTIVGYAGPPWVVTIPAIINGLTVTSIGNSAFYTNSSLAGVTIPNNITNIGDYAFYKCSSLSNVTIANSVTTIGAWSFFFDVSLSNITIPNSVTTIGEYAFNHCHSLQSVIIGTNVTNIGKLAFAQCFSLTNITIPDKVTSISDYMLFDDIALPNVTIPNSVTSIGNHAFDTCGLNNIKIGTNVTSIGTNAFYMCDSLTSMTLPMSVTNIDEDAFAGCLNLYAIYFQGNAPSADSTVFSQGTGDFGGPGGLGAFVYYLPNTKGWYSPFGGLPAKLWNPSIQTTNFSFGVQNNQFGFNITGTTNIPIVVEACTSLANATWIPLNSCFVTNGSIFFSDSQWTNHSTRFYRISSQ